MEMQTAFLENIEHHTLTWNNEDTWVSEWLSLTASLRDRTSRSMLAKWVIKYYINIIIFLTRITHTKQVTTNFKT